MSTGVTWILWSDLLDGQDWVLYSVVDGAMNWLPCPARQKDGTQGLCTSLFGCLNQAECVLNSLVR